MSVLGQYYERPAVQVEAHYVDRALLFLYSRGSCVSQPRNTSRLCACCAFASFVFVVTIRIHLDHQSIVAADNFTQLLSELFGRHCRSQLVYQHEGGCSMDDARKIATHTHWS